ncbi:hypothetical protein JTE90_022705 [Oedothorax gibbosus]|uniref:Uncharacterized protein n=1 Tax=Oedothorax gibbosus TaxID=931172 RepID=A0AAV6UJU5_9ARAC|nr:hypothetical protein JTE90_022705 [Oedothorax gibbosus]
MTKKRRPSRRDKDCGNSKEQIHGPPRKRIKSHCPPSLQIIQIRMPVEGTRIEEVDGKTVIAFQQELSKPRGTTVSEESSGDSQSREHFHHYLYGTVPRKNGSCVH